MTPPAVIPDLFAGPGGWSTGLRRLGMADVGLEWDPWACATRAAAGHVTIRADVAEYPPERFVGAEGLIASPPCPAFSQAGKREGIEDIPRLIDHLHSCAAAGWRPPSPDPWSHFTSPLVLEPLRWTWAIRPEWVALEQVPDVLPAWEATSAALRAWGYSTWVGVLNSADYGVPQTRKRAILMASRVRSALPPEPTHSDQRKSPDLFLRPWVSMAEALGWGLPDQPSPVVMTARGRQTGEHDALRGSSWRHEWFQRQQADGNWVVRTGANTMKHNRDVADVVPYERTIEEPAPTVDTKAHSAWTLNTRRDQREDGSTQTRPADAPAPAVTAMSAGSGQWVWERPATTVVGSFRPDVIAAPGYRTTGDGPRQNAPGSIKVELWECGVLQDFPADYPWQGNKSQRGQQIGNAIPPGLSAAVVGTLTGRDLRPAAELDEIAS